METEKVDKAALGYDYKGQTDKHQSQKGEPAPGRSSPLTLLTPSLLPLRLLQGLWREVWCGEGESGQSRLGLRLQERDREASVSER